MKTVEFTNDIRQGDVLLVPVSNLPAGCKDITPKSGRVVLAYGEVTGHAHAIYDVIDADTKQHKVRLFDAGVERFLQVLAPVSLKHEEHTAHTINPGIYKLPAQVEYSPAELRRVAD